MGFASCFPSCFPEVSQHLHVTKSSATCPAVRSDGARQSLSARMHTNSHFTVTTCGVVTVHWHITLSQDVTCFNEDHVLARAET